MIYPFARGHEPLNPLPRKVGRVHYEAFQRFVYQVRAIRFTWQTDIGTPYQMAQLPHGYTHKSRGCPIPDFQAILTPIKVTTNKLEKVLILS